MDYKNTPEGKAVQSKYGKILHASRPEPPHNLLLPPYEAMRMRLLPRAETTSKEIESS